MTTSGIALVRWQRFVYQIVPGQNEERIVPHLLCSGLPEAFLPRAFLRSHPADP
jgi:hypothetical protein